MHLHLDIFGMIPTLKCLKYYKYHTVDGWETYSKVKLMYCMRQIQIMGLATTLNKTAYQCICSSQVHTSLLKWSLIFHLKNKMDSVPVTEMPTKHYLPPLRLSLGISHLWLGECLQIERQTNNINFFVVPFNLMVGGPTKDQVKQQTRLWWATLSREFKPARLG